MTDSAKDCSLAHRRFCNEVYHPHFDNEDWDKHFVVPTINAKP